MILRLKILNPGTRIKLESLHRNLKLRIHSHQDIHKAITRRRTRPDRLQLLFILFLLVIP